MTVKQILDEKGHKVVTVHSSMSVLGASRFLAENKIGAVIVSDDGTSIAGILSEEVEDGVDGNVVTHFNKVPVYNLQHFVCKKHYFSL